jgi:fructose-specific phosphotransferase system IIC component
MLALGLLGGSFATLSVSKDQHNTLRNVFSGDLEQKYNSIVEERRNHYFMGLVLGIVLSYVVVNKMDVPNDFTRMSLFFTITLITALFFYTLMPKSDYMLNHLKTPEENMKWLQVYKHMKNRYFLGFILGTMSAIPLANTLC